MEQLFVEKKRNVFNGGWQGGRKKFIVEGGGRERCVRGEAGKEEGEEE